MTNQDLSIIGIESGSREEANEAADQIDGMAATGDIDVKEVAVAHKNTHGRVKVHYVTDHGAGIGALAGGGIGAAWLTGAAIAGTVVTTGGTILPILLGAGIAVGGGAAAGGAIGKAFDLHHQGAKNVLEGLTVHVENGHAVTFAVVDAASGDTLEAAFSDHDVHRTTLTGQEQERIVEELSTEH